MTEAVTVQSSHCNYISLQNVLCKIEDVGRGEGVIMAGRNARGLKTSALAIATTTLGGDVKIDPLACSNVIVVG